MNLLDPRSDPQRAIANGHMVELITDRKKLAHRAHNLAVGHLRGQFLRSAMTLRPVTFLKKSLCVPLSRS
jgi:hypothetical protein